MLARRQRRRGNGRVPVVRRGDDHTVQMLLLFQHHPKVRVFRGLGRRLPQNFPGGGQLLVVHLAERNDVRRATADFREPAPTHAAKANMRHIQFLRRVPGAQHVWKTHGRGTGGQSGSLQEIPAGPALTGSGLFG